MTMFATLIFSGALAFFQTQNANDVLEKVRKAYDSIKDASADFDQMVTYKVTKLNQKLTGRISVKKQDKLRLETEEQILVTDGKTAWTYSIFNEKVIIDHFDPSSSELSPSRFFLEFPKDFIMTVVGKETIGGMVTWKLNLTPKNSDNFIQAMSLWADEKEWFIRQVEVRDINGSNTTYRLKQLQINSGLPDQWFQFTPPKGVDIIDLR